MFCKYLFIKNVALLSISFFSYLFIFEQNFKHMKKIVLAGALALIGLMNVNAQEGHFKLGAHVGLPVGDFSDSHSFNLGLDVAYLWQITNEFELGATTGFTNYFGKKETFMGYSFTYDDVQMIPLAATAKFNIVPQFFVGTDIGYVFFLNKDSDTGAFYYQPKVGYNLEKSEIFVGYKGMAKSGETLGAISLGYAYNF